VLTVLVIVAAIIHHLVSAKVMGGGLKASDHIRYAPGLSVVYDRAKERFFDPYDIWLKISTIMAKLFFWIDRGIDWFYESFVTALANAASLKIRKLHNGYYATYISWALLGMILIVVFLRK
jgi:hypothetical protein